MKQGRTLTDLGAELQRQASAKRDYLAPAQALSVKSNGHTELTLQEPFVVGEIAHGQIAEYVGIPKAFYDRLRNDASTLQVPMFAADKEWGHQEMPLFDVVVNRLLQSKAHDVRLVRTLDGKTRAFLSQTFNTDLDNWDVLAVAAKAMEQMGLCPDNVAACEVTERRLYLKVVSPRLEAVIRPDNLHREHGGHHFLKEPQVVQAGFILTNSETGLGALSVQQTVYKLQCTNLFIKEEAYRQRHLGRALQAEEDGTVYKSDTRQAEAKARLLKIRDHIEDALSETRFKALVAHMQEAATVKLEGSVEKVVEVTARKFGLSTDEKDSVLKNLIEGADLSLWGLGNAITATAQEATSFDRSTDLECVGGRLFSLTAPEVKELVRAA